MRASSCVLVALLCGVARADDAAKWAESVGGMVTRDDKAAGKPVVGATLAFNKKVTDDGLKNLTGCKNLKMLSLFFNEQITDAGMKHVKELAALEALTISNTSVSDAGVAELKGLKNLKAFHTAGCIKMTDKGTATIAGFAALEEVSLRSTITDKGAKNLVGLKKLKSLYLGGCTALTDAAVKDIATSLPDLHSLDVGATLGTEITDTSVPHLAQLQKLKTLGLLGAKISDSGLKVLREKLPNCTITK